MEASVSGAGARREPDDIFVGHDISWIAEHVADPAHHSGGVVIAAITLAGASAAAELVLNLAVRRKSHAGSKEEIEAAIARIRDLREQFLLAADEDMAAFERLLEVQRAKREGRPGAEDELP